MTNLRTKLTTLFTAAVMIMTMPVAAFGGRVFAEDGVKEGTYRVEGFNQAGIITDPDGNTLEGVVAFCLDTKLHPPVASVDYTGKSLSELTDYDTTVEITNL
ncbi:MAG: hypothetical protein II714_02165, partial [Oscillospiraceae bacterium]|nr:hypothetical protein [Oscillospiraceae bacterium]